MMRCVWGGISKLAVALFVYLFAASPSLAASQHGISMLGEPHYAAGFTHYGYTDPGAAKGGKLRQAVMGTFDNLNPFTIKGDIAVGLTSNVFETLMSRAFDEPFSLYGLIAESVETPEDRSWVEFTLRKEAHFSDGAPITPEDALFSWEVLKEHGRPNHRNYYPKVAKAEKVGEHGVRFTFKPGTDREMPLIMGLMPVLPRSAYTADTFEQTTLKATGSGPYVVAEAVSGRTLTLKRDPNYWGRDLAVNRGRFNFDELGFEYYRDQTAMFESFKAGQHDFTEENDAKQWQVAYDFPAMQTGVVKKIEIPLALPAPIAALVFNLRKPMFADQRVRKAFNILFDFAWINHNLFGGAFTRQESYFDRSALSARGQPANDLELALLKPFPDAVAPDIMAGTHKFPVSDGQGWNRDNARAALELFKQAGWEPKGGVLTNVQTGEAFSIEVPAKSRTEERLLQAFASQLKRTGIDLRVRSIDAAQYQQRLNTFSYDMIYYTWYTSLSPGNEQNVRWSSASADTPGSFNFAGIKNPAADAMIDALIHAKDQASLTAAVRALDRVLLSGDYIIPLYYPAKQWVAYRTNLRYPATTSLYGYLLDTWWSTP